ncbi:MAG: ABC transporter ATP-binding protein [Promethearchaeota archaeon]
MKENLNETIDELEDEDLIADLSQKNIIIFGRNLIRNYDIGDFIVKAVDNVSLQVEEGEFIAIKGPSGAGKTTLLNLLGGLDTPNSGIIYNQGVRISDMDQETLTIFRLASSGFIFQNYNLISTLTAEENVMLPMNLAGMKLKEQRDRAVQLLTMVRLDDRREHLPFQLSAGEQQRVAIARALSNEPPVILADEPTANLDKTTNKIIRELFEELKRKGKTIIVATHDEDLIALADNVISFNDGMIVEEE